MNYNLHHLLMESGLQQNPREFPQYFRNTLLRNKAIQ